MPFSKAVLAMNDLMDAALSEQLRRVWGRQSEGQGLERLFPDVAARHVEEALAHATLLLASAFSAGHEALSSSTPDLAAIIARLRGHHPGFSEARYYDVINFGCFLAR